MHNTILPSIGEFKKQAKKYKKENKIKTLGESLDILAKKHGYRNWFTIKTVLSEDAEPSMIATVYTTIYMKDTSLDNAPYLEICSSRSEQEDNILWMINEEYDKKFESFEDAWIFHLDELKDEDDWIRIENKEVEVYPTRKPKPIFSQYGDSTTIDGKKYYTVVLQDDLRSQYFEEYYETIKEAELRNNEIESLATHDWGLVMKEGMHSSYSYMFNQKSSRYIKVELDAKHDKNNAELFGEYAVITSTECKNQIACALNALSKIEGAGSMKDYRIELHDIHDMKIEFSGEVNPKELSESGTGRILAHRYVSDWANWEYSPHD